MDQLPNELIDYLCHFLSDKDLKAFRLTCQGFARIGQSHLFHDFEFRLIPNPARLRQLGQLVAHSSISQQLKTLTFESGVALEYADYRYWQALTYQDIAQEWSRTVGRTTPSAASRDEDYKLFHNALQARFKPEMGAKYDLLRWHLDQEGREMAESRVRNILMRLINTLGGNRSDSTPLIFKLSMVEPRITLDQLESFEVSNFKTDNLLTHIDQRQRVFNRRRFTLQHFINFLDAANLSHTPPQHLELDMIPHQLLTVDGIHGAEVLTDTFRSLTSLGMSISSFPHSDWLSRSADGGDGEIYFGGRNLAARKLTKLLNLPSDLLTLRLKLPLGKEAEYSFDLFDRTNLDRFPRLWLRHLRTMSLSTFRCTGTDLEALLNEARHVQSLRLSDCRLEAGSMVELIQFLRGKTLDDISLEGTWTVDEDGGEWHSHLPEDFSDCSALTSFEGPYRADGMRDKVHAYMLGQPPTGHEGTACRSGGGGPTCPLPELGPRPSDWAVARIVWDMAGDTSWHYLPGPRR